MRSLSVGAQLQVAETVVSIFGWLRETLVQLVVLGFFGGALWTMRLRDFERYAARPARRVPLRRVRDDDADDEEDDEEDEDARRERQVRTSLVVVQLPPTPMSDLKRPFAPTLALGAADGALETRLHERRLFIDAQWTFH